MRVLAVDGFRAHQAGKQLLTAAIETLDAAGHDVHRLDLEASDFSPFMSEDERRRYHDVEDNICAPDVAASVELLLDADAVVFGYETTVHTLPAHLKGWLERTLVPGVGFVLNEHNKVRPGLSSVRRVGAVTTTPHRRRATLLAGDGGRRTLMRSFRANCAARCKRTFVSVHDQDLSNGRHRVARAFGSW